jgi:hypothetical protein
LTHPIHFGELLQFEVILLVAFGHPTVCAYESDAVEREVSGRRINFGSLVVKTRL